MIKTNTGLCKFFPTSNELNLMKSLEIKLNENPTSITKEHFLYLAKTKAKIGISSAFIAGSIGLPTTINAIPVYEFISNPENSSLLKAGLSLAYTFPVIGTCVTSIAALKFGVYDSVKRYQEYKK